MSIINNPKEEAPTGMTASGVPRDVTAAILVSIVNQPCAS